MTATVHIANRDGGTQRRKHCTHRIFYIKWLFEDTLDTLGDNTEIENDFEEGSESVSNTPVIYYTCFFFYHLSLNEN